jgi:7-cyano-7-deazaguanine synthase
MLIALSLVELHPKEQLICIGIHAGTPFVDCSRAFFEGAAKLTAEQTDSRVRLVAPLLDLVKQQIVDLACANGWSLVSTYSCQKGLSVPCGRCLSCRDRTACGC